MEYGPYLACCIWSLPGLLHVSISFIIFVGVEYLYLTGTCLLITLLGGEFCTLQVLVKAAFTLKIAQFYFFTLLRSKVKLGVSLSYVNVAGVTCDTIAFFTP